MRHFRISGLDINGWKDVAARDWDPDQDENEDDQTQAIRILDGGVGSVAVRLNSDRWMGGPQALLAPHGRGGGWGDVGARDRRVPLLQSWQDLASSEDSGDIDALKAATHALTRGAERVVFAVPDVPECDEALQDRILAALPPRFRWRRLLWRPVAAFLGALEQGDIPKDADDARFRFFIHTGDGIHEQTLRLRRDSEHRGHMAPERDGYGRHIVPALGLAQLRRLVHEAVLDFNPVLKDRERACEESKLALRLLFGTTSNSEREILRLDNGNWIDVAAPTIDASDLFAGADLEGESALENREALTTFLLTPLADPFASALAGLLRRFTPDLHRLNWDTIARGSLRAGRLIHEGKPHYFDRLTPIRLAVMRNSEPAFEDLIVSTATLPADREYVSPPYGSLHWRAGMSNVDFYVLKGDNEIRHWTVQIAEPPTDDVAIELRLRQTPGQSWAKLSMTSPEWEPLQRNPIFLDWAKLKPISESPEVILEKLRNPPPPIPKRVVELPSIEFWEGSDRVPTGLMSILNEMNDRGQFILDNIASLLQRSQRDPVTRIRTWAVGTDGDLPDQLPERARTLFRVALSKCEQEIEAAYSRPLRDNGALKCLTWVFTKCPVRIQDEILAALEADRAGRAHPLCALQGSKTVLIQGAGRAITGEIRLRRALVELTAVETNNNTLNALAMILSRRKEAPQALTPTLVRKIVSAITSELEGLSGASAFQVRFKNTLSAIAGLFRYREVEPYALLATRDAAARRLRNRIDRVDALLTRHRAQVRLYEEKKALLAVIREYLDGAGDPNILIRIENLD